MTKVPEYDPNDPEWIMQKHGWSRAEFDKRMGIVAEHEGIPTEETITLTNGRTLAVGDECLAGYPQTLRYRKATITRIFQESGERYASVQDTQGGEWDVISYGLRAI